MSDGQELLFNQGKMVTKVFDNRMQAEQAATALEEAGFPKQQILIEEAKPEIMDPPGKNETVQAQNETVFSWVGGALGVIVGIIVVVLVPDLSLAAV